MNRRLMFALPAAAMLSTLLALGPHPDDPPPVRLGTYDSRAIAIAWARSEFSPMPEKMKEYEAAKSEGNKDRQAELEDWGRMEQRLLHFQGFGKYPVDNCIDDISAQLPDVMRKHHLDAIVWMPHATAENVEVVDVTVDLMTLFGMDEAKAAKTVQEMAGHEPLDFATLFNMSPED